MHSTGRQHMPVHSHNEGKFRNNTGTHLPRHRDLGTGLGQAEVGADKDPRGVRISSGSGTSSGTLTVSLPSLSMAMDGEGRLVSSSWSRRGEKGEERQEDGGGEQKERREGDER